MTRDDAQRLDAEDPLRAERDAFVLPAATIYLDGNSLGPLTHAARAAVQTALQDEWGEQMIGAWNGAGWVDLPLRVGALIAPIVGAAPNNVVCCDSTSINLFKVVATALQMRTNRRRIVSERGNFPTDLYIASECARLVGAGQELTLVDDQSELDALIDDQLAVLMLTHVDYRTGRMHDMARITRRAQAHGALVIWDLAHSAGAVPLALEACNVDFAIGCGYKYLNGGPGAPAFVYVHPRHQDALVQPLAGWFGHAAPFDFDADYRPAAGIASYQSGTPTVLAMRCLEAALGLWERIDIADIRAKSIALCELFMAEVAARIDEPDLLLASPRDAASRGSQLSYRHPAAYAVMQALISAGVIGDMRAPDILRFGFTPLYTRYVDVFDAVTVLAEILADKRYQKPEFRREADPNARVT